MNKQQTYRTIFNKVDPVGIFFDENVDEYDPEIKELLNSNIDLKNFQKVKEKLSLIFKKYFEGIVIDENKITELALLIQKEDIK